MADSLYRALIRPDVLGLFGRLFPNAVSAEMLLLPLGAEPARLPPFGALTPGQWWFAAFTEIDRGAFAFGLDAVLRAAAEQYPAHRELGLLAARAGHGPAAVPATRPLTVLLLQASPTDQARLRLDVEQRTLRELGGSRLRAEYYAAARVTDILPALLAVQPDVVHFSGHGSAAGELIFEDEHGRAVPVPASALAHAFEATARLECVVLNSCYTAGYAEALEKSARVVVGSSTALLDPCAHAFTRGFYQALVHGKDVREAYRVALAEMALGRCTTGGMRIHPAPEGDT